MIFEFEFSWGSGKKSTSMMIDILSEKKNMGKDFCGTSAK